MAITFHKDSTVSLGSFIQVLAGGLPIGRIFHVNNVYRFSPGDEAQRGEADLHPGDEPTLGAATLQSQDLDRLKDTIRERYRPDGS